MRHHGGSDRPKAVAGHMPFAGHRAQSEISTAEGGAMKRPAVLATFQPAQKQVLVIVAGGNPSGIALDLDEARQIHAALGQALKLADATEWPLEACR